MTVPPLGGKKTVLKKTKPQYLPYGKLGFTLKISSTQLKKSTINANKIVQGVLRRSGLIDFRGIEPGEKVVLPCKLHMGASEASTKCSFLIPKRRGETNPEPRMWPYKLNRQVRPGQMLWFISHQDHLEVRDSEP